MNTSSAKQTQMLLLLMLSSLVEGNKLLKFNRKAFPLSQTLT